MINFMIVTMMLSMVWILLNSSNPMKTSFFILISAALMFFYTKMVTGMTWLPLMFFILFTGGILLMFMILSSVLPNEKTLKIKYSKMLMIAMIIVGLISTKMNSSGETASQMKSFLSSGLNLIFMTSIILVYFFNSINFNSLEETPMRSLQC